MGKIYNVQLKDEPGSFRSIYIKRIINEYNKIKSQEMDKSFQNYLLKNYNITYGNPNGSGQLPKLETFLVKQTNLNLKNINEIIEALKTDKQLAVKDGKGLKPTEKQIHKKYFIDTNKLNNNVLEVRYNKNRHLTGIKTQIIGNGVKNIISNIIDNDNMDQTEYDTLSDSERHLIRTILNMLEKSHLIKNKDEEFNEKFQILLGSYNAGNNSEILKNQLKQYVLHAMRLNLIPRNVGNSMLLELSL
jgi:hypothetical protein